MFANYLIGLREGLEAALVVSILVAYLVKSGHTDRLRPVWGGVLVAVAVSLGFGALLTFTSNQLSFEAQEAFGGSLSILAVGFVTWMVFWMRRTARNLSRELRGRMEAALAIGSGALVFTAFIAVGREGLETSLFIWSAVQATGESTQPVLGAALGLVSAVVLGYLFYKGALRINLAKFFTWTGAALIVVAAGVLAYGLHDLQEAGILPGLNSLAFDISGTLPPDSWYGTLLRGTINLTPTVTWLQAVAWLAYIVPVTVLFFRPARTAPPAAATPAAATRCRHRPQRHGHPRPRRHGRPARRLGCGTPDPLTRRPHRHLAAPPPGAAPPDRAARPAGRRAPTRPAAPPSPAPPRAPGPIGVPPPMARRPVSLLCLTALAAAPALAGCGGGSEDAASSGTEVAVRASDSACEVERTDLDAGSTTFAVSNEGSKVTEVYVYGERDGSFSKVVSEVENIGPGTSRDMTVSLGGGTYEVACKPGQTGDGIRTRITVAGTSGTSGAPGASASASGDAEGEGYDREIELATDGKAITGLSGGAERGERIEFKLTNNADAARTLELKEPDGTVADEVEDIAPGETGEVVVDLDEAGTWQVIVEGDGVDDVTAELAVS